MHSIKYLLNIGKCMRLTGKDGAKMVALVPVIDMLDHNPEHRVSWTTGSKGDQAFQLVTHSGVARVR